LDPTSVQADNGGGLTKGIIGLVNKGQPRKPDQWGALKAWAWGAGRVLDYLQIDRRVNAKKVGWMAGNYVKYAGPLTPKDFPVDARGLVALCAPRPVFVGVGSPNVEGIWIDSRGTFMATSLASPVYELLGNKGLGTTEMPPEGTPLIGGDLAFSQHHGGHSNGPNWPTFIEFASRYLD